MATVEIKKVAREAENDRLLETESRAMEKLLLKQNRQETKPPRSAEDDGWQLIRKEEKEEIEYTDLEADAPGNTLHRAAKELNVRLKVIWVYARARGKGAGGNNDGKPDGEFASAKELLKEQEIREKVAKAEMLAAKLVEAKLEQEEYEKTLVMFLLLLSSLPGSEASAFSIPAQQQEYNNFVTGIENPLVALQAMPRANEFQEELLERISVMPVTQQVTMIPATYMVSPDNPAFVPAAGSTLESAHLFNADAAPQDKQLAAALNDTLQDPVFMQGLEKELVSLSSTLASSVFGMMQRNAVTASPLMDAPFENSFTASPLHDLPEFSLPLPGRQPSANDFSPVSLKEQPLANDPMFQPDTLNNHLTPEEFAQDLKPLPLQQALFNDQQQEMLQVPEPVYAEPAYQAAVQNNNIINNPFSLMIPNTLTPTASFYSDLGLASSPSSAGSLGSGSGSGGGGTSDAG